EHRLAAAVAPTLPATAARADHLFAGYEDGSEEEVSVAFTRFTMPFNATGQPVISVPGGFDRDGLPIGLSIIGRPHAELDLCALAHVYEQAAGWWQRRPPIAQSAVERRG
ncbi:MAG TPA: amidase family protein, partial [Gemmatimonadales bacterium]|nr:amidase family protein [Gemmatimonadales bacterium]